MSTTVRPSVVNNGITTSWLPLTTPGVSAPPECSSEIYRVPGGQDIMAFDPYYAKNIPSALQCLPVEVTKSWEQTGVTITTSLGGFNCPSLYTKAATASLNKISAIVACCPSLYNYRSDNKCISTVPAGQTVVVKNLSANNVVRAENTNNGGITVTGFLVSGYSFADDPALVTTTITGSSIPTSNPEISAGSSISSSPSSSSPGSVPQIPSSALSTSTSTPTPLPAIIVTPSGLSIGAKVGITIGVVFTVIIIICLLASLHVRRRRRSHPSYMNSSSRSETGILEISREPRSIKNNVPITSISTNANSNPLSSPTQYPGSDGLQTVLPPGVHEQKAREIRAREQTEKHPGTRIHINSLGPHEMEVAPSNVKFEMDAGSVKRPKTKTSSTPPSQEQQQQPHLPPRSRTGSAATLRTIPLSPVSRNQTPDLIHQHTRNLSNHTPVSSFGRTTPNRSVSRNTSLNDLRNARSGSLGDLRTSGRNGRLTPDVLGGSSRDTRLDVAGGCISPVSTAERSFLDLSDLDD